MAEDAAEFGAGKLAPLLFMSTKLLVLEQKPKKKNPARRERLNKEWPFKIYSYDAFPQKPPPKALWDTAHGMKRLWNDLTAKFKSVSDRDLKDEEKKPLLSKEDRKILWGELNLKELREHGKTYSDQLDAACREFVINAFLVTLANWRKNPQRYGPPRFHHEIDSIHIPLDFNAGKSADWITNGSTASMRDTLDLKGDKEKQSEYLNNGHFSIGINRAPWKLHVAYGGRSGQHRRLLPEIGRIKRISLIGRKDSAFGWRWQIQVRYEQPAEQPRETTGRVAGWDSGGWRLMEDRIRVGVLADNAGYFYEISIPMAIGLLNRETRKDIMWCQSKGIEYTKPLTWYDLFDLDSRYGLALEECKRKLRIIYEREKETWPPRARKIMGGIVKMRDTGLNELRRLIEPIESQAKSLIDEWIATSEKLNRQIRAFEAHATAAKLNAYREVIAWMKVFDVIAWEGDLSLKEMAEDGGKRKKKRKEIHEAQGQWVNRSGDEIVSEESQKFRQIAGQYQLRALARERHGTICRCGAHFLQHQEGFACKEFVPRLQNEKAAYSTLTCPECDGAVERTRKLVLTCENGHSRDQDVAASLYFLNKIKGHTSITAEPLEIPAHLRPYLRVMDVDEVRLELTGKR